MKRNYHHKILITLVFLLGISTGKLLAQDTEEAPVTLSLQYFLPENKVPYINVVAKRKVGRIFEPVKGVTVNVYLTAVAENNLLGKAITADNGTARIAFPAGEKTAFDALDEFTVVAESVPKAKEEVLNAELVIKKAILIVDTADVDGVRTVTGQLKEKKGNEWIPVAAVEMKLKIKRLLGNLTVGEAETYTSDTSGIASAGFIRDSIPGDKKGNIILVARVEDNDTYGNLIAEKTVPWGKAVQADTHFWQRTLWSTGNRAPVWLMVIAFSIIVGVWGTLVYLLRQTIRIRKMGKALDRKPAS